MHITFVLIHEILVKKR